MQNWTYLVLEFICEISKHVPRKCKLASTTVFVGCIAGEHAHGMTRRVTYLLTSIYLCIMIAIACFGE
jgi:hypothetical protein